jgi:hypothetical protein
VNRVARHSAIESPAAKLLAQGPGYCPNQLLAKSPDDRFEPKLPDVALFSNDGNVGESGRRNIARYGNF